MPIMREILYIHVSQLMRVIILYMNTIELEVCESPWAQSIDRDYTTLCLLEV